MTKEDYKLKSLLTSQAVKSNPKMTTFVVEEDKTPEIYNSILADEYILPTAYLIILKATDETYSARLGDGVNVWSDSASMGGSSSITWEDTSMLPVAGKIPVWSEQGLLSTGEPLFPENAVNLNYLQTLTGWAIYNDSTHTSGSPLVSTVGNRVKITNNAGTIINDQLPLGVTSFWNNTSNKITPDSLGDSYNINLRFIAVSTSNQGLADVEIDVGGSLGVISGTTISMRKGIGAEQKVNINFDVYSGSTFIANGGDFYIKSIDGDTSIHDIRLKVTRIHKGK